MTTSSGESDDRNDSSYTDVQIHDSQLPDDLQPENDIAPTGTQHPSEDAAGAGADDQLGQAPEATGTATHGDAEATDGPG